jgi:hypothetical protein
MATSNDYYIGALNDTYLLIVINVNLELISSSSSSRNSTLV